jgi:hypothetical protein
MTKGKRKMLRSVGGGGGGGGGGLGGDTLERGGSGVSSVVGAHPHVRMHASRDAVGSETTGSLGHGAESTPVHAAVHNNNDDADDADNNNNADSVGPPGMLATGHFPIAGVRVWLKIQRVNESSFGGVLVCAVHWVAPSQTRVGWLSRMAALPPDHRAGWVTAPPDVSADLVRPALSIESALESEVVESDLYYRPSTGDVLEWIGVRVLVAARSALDRFPLDRQHVNVFVKCRGFRLSHWSLVDPPPINTHLVRGREAAECRVDIECGNEWTLVEVLPLAFGGHSTTGQVVLSLRVERGTEYYLWSIGLVNFLCVFYASDLLVTNSARCAACCDVALCNGQWDAHCEDHCAACCDVAIMVNVMLTVTTTVMPAARIS